MAEQAVSSRNIHYKSTHSPKEKSSFLCSHVVLQSGEEVKYSLLLFHSVVLEVNDKPKHVHDPTKNFFPSGPCRISSTDILKYVFILSYVVVAVIWV